MFYSVVMSSTPSATTVVDPLREWRAWGREDISEELLALSEVVTVPDEVLLEEIGTVPAATALAALEGIDPSTLDPHGVLDFLRAAERIDAFTAALKARARVALAGAQVSAELVREMHVEHELAVATRSSRYAAGTAIERARVLTTTFPLFLDALAAGQVSEAHCRVLVEATRTCTDAHALAAVQRVTLPKAKRMTPGEFRSAVAKAVADHDPNAAGRHKAAREQRTVWTRELEDGMSYLGLVHDTTTITAIKATLDTDAAALRTERGGPAALLAGEEDASAGACRADALAARILGTTDETGAVDCTPKSADVQVQLVIDLDTLRGETDRHCLLDGQPVPGEVGRELASYARAFRRMVTDPLTGHLLDYGRVTYLPAPLRTYVLARDGGCRAPGCTVRSPRRLQMDHAVSFPEGPSDRANTGCVCIPNHQVKTAALSRIENSKADGSCDWITAWGQRIHIPRQAVSPRPRRRSAAGPTTARGHPALLIPAVTATWSPMGLLTVREACRVSCDAGPCCDRCLSRARRRCGARRGRRRPAVRGGGGGRRRGPCPGR
jgi:hypothetical protein